MRQRCSQLLLCSAFEVICFAIFLVSIFIFYYIKSSKEKNLRALTQNQIINECNTWLLVGLDDKTL